MEHLNIHQYAGHTDELNQERLSEIISHFLTSLNQAKSLPKLQIDARGIDRVMTYLMPDSIAPSKYTTPAKWDIWNQAGGPKYPHEKIIQFMFRSVPKSDRTSTRVLDLGCGSGVHTEFLATEDFETYACDISAIGIQNTCDRLRKNNLTATIWQSGLERIPIQDNYFDIIISCSVFEAAGLEAVQKSMPEIIRILKKGGKGFFLFASDRDFRVQGENSLNLHGFSDLEVEQIFKSQTLDLLYIDRYITTFQNQAIQSNDFLVTIQK
jgi:ubiquinone/menaquinone biosynthesis C-methylase UbiE